MDDYYHEKEDFRETPACKQCGLTPLHWKQVNGKWRLHEPSGKPHTCRPKIVFDPA